MIRRTTLLLTLVLALAPGAAFGSADDIYDDCQDGRMDRSYSQKEYREALKGMPGDLDEYTNCRELIRSAAQGVRSSGGSGPGGAGQGGYGALPAGEGGLPLDPESKPVDPVKIAQPDERADIERARDGDGLSDVPVGAANVAAAGLRPGADSSSSLPTPVVVLLILTALGALAGIVLRLKDLVLRRPAA